MSNTLTQGPRLDPIALERVFTHVFKSTRRGAIPYKTLDDPGKVPEARRAIRTVLVVQPFHDKAKVVGRAMRN